MNNSRTYGIEVEFLVAGKSGQQVANHLTSRTGIQVEAQGYNHTTQPVWKLVTDSSLSGAGMRGFELVSPKLKGESGLEQVTLLMKALNELDVKVNRTCGLHVHHDVNDKDLEAFKKIVVRYMKLEKAFDNLMPESRRGNRNSYSRSMKITGRDNESATNLAKRIQGCQSIQEIQYFFNTRYLKLNLQSYSRYGTVEVRQHAGTTDAEKITNWVRLTQRLMENTEKAIKFNVNHKDNVTYIKQTLHIESDDEIMAEVLKYYRRRAKELAA